MAQKNRDYVNSVFAKVVWRENRSEEKIMISLGIKRADLIKQLNSMEENEKGFVNITLGSQKDDPDKLSAWKSEETRQSSSSRSTPNSSNSTRQSNQAPKPSTDNNDDLPF